MINVIHGNKITFIVIVIVIVIEPMMAYVYDAYMRHSVLMN